MRSIGKGAADRTAPRYQAWTGARCAATLPRAANTTRWSAATRLHQLIWWLASSSTSSPGAATGAGPGAAAASAKRVRALQEPVRVVTHSGVRLTNVSHEALLNLMALQLDVGQSQQFGIFAASVQQQLQQQQLGVARHGPKRLE